MKDTVEFANPNNNEFRLLTQNASELEAIEFDMTNLDGKIHSNGTLYQIIA